MEGKIIKNWFEELDQVDQRIIMAIKEGSSVDHHPTMYSSAIDFFFDVHETHKLCIYK